MMNANSAATFTFTSTSPVDTFTVWFPTNGVLGTISLSVDGGEAVVVDENQASGFKTVMSVAAPGIHTLSLLELSDGRTSRKSTRH